MSLHMVRVSEVQSRGEEPVKLNVKKEMRTPVGFPLMLVVSMWCVYGTIRRTHAIYHCIVVSDPGRSYRYCNFCHPI